jgi:choice-of-anchor C domain-containing protein
MSYRLVRAGALLCVVTGAVAATRVLADDLPADAVRRVKQFEDEVAAIRKKADADVSARLDKLIADLEQLKTEHTKAGDLDAALAVRERIGQLRAVSERARNLLVNGSFEEGPETPKNAEAFVTLEKDSTALKGWVVGEGNIDVVDSSYWKAADGKRSLDMNGGTAGAISQTFKTKKGKKYRVRFALAGSPGNAPAEKKLQVSAAGETAEFTFDVSGKSRTDMGWERKTWEFTAAADQTTLEFLSLTEGHAGPALDDVVVVAVDE